MSEEGDTRTYVNDNKQTVRQVYKCKFRIPGMGISKLCTKNQHGCVEMRRKASVPCNRKDLVWMRDTDFQ